VLAQRETLYRASLQWHLQQDLSVDVSRVAHWRCIFAQGVVLVLQPFGSNPKPASLWPLAVLGPKADIPCCQSLVSHPQIPPVPGRASRAIKVPTATT
jgi:hypothetical protein